MMGASLQFKEGFTLVALLGLIGTSLRSAWNQLSDPLVKRTVELDARESAFEDTRDSRVRVLEVEVGRHSEQLQKVTEFVGR